MPSPFDSPLLLTSSQSFGVANDSFSKIFEKTSDNRVVKPETSWISAPVRINNTQKLTLSFWFKNSLRTSGSSNFIEIRSNNPFTSAVTGAEKVFIFKLFCGDGTTDPVTNFYIENYGASVVNASRYITNSIQIQDTAAWYHIVLAIDTTQATPANRIKLYVNNKLCNYTTSSGWSLNEQLFINHNTNPTLTNLYNVTYGAGTSFTSSNGSALNAIQDNSLYGQLAEVNFITGQQLDATFFGTYDYAKGAPRWVPKKYAGSYATGSHYLEMKTGTGGSIYGWIDSSPNGYVFYQTINSVIQDLRANQQVVDVPFTFSNNNIENSIGKDSRGNYCTLQGALHSYNGINGTPEFNNGNLNLSVQSGQDNSTWSTTPGTMSFSDSSWYYEATINGLNNTANIKDRFRVGLMVNDGSTPQSSFSDSATTSRLGYNPTSWAVGVDGTNGLFFENNNIKTVLASTGISPCGTVFNVNDTIGCYFDLFTNKIYFSYNNIWLNKYSLPSTAPSVNWWRVDLALLGTTAIACSRTATGAVYKSIDGGQNWSALSITIGLTNYSTGDWTGVATSCTGALLLAVKYNDKIYLTTNSGSTWTQQQVDAGIPTNKWTGCAVNSGLSSPGKYQAVYCSETTAAIPGVWISNNFGTIWNKTLNEQVVDLVISETGQIMYAITSSTSPTPNSCWRSTDYGQTWSQPSGISNLLSIAGGTNLEGIAFSKNDNILANNKIVIITINSGAGGGLRSTDGGATWSIISNNSITGRFAKPSMSGNGQYQMIVGRNTTSTVQNLTPRVLLSIDYGATWTEEQATTNTLATQLARDYICCAIQGFNDTLTPTAIILTYPSGTTGGRLIIAKDYLISIYGGTPAYSNITTNVTPAISFYRGASVTAENNGISNNKISVNFGQKPFKYKLTNNLGYGLALNTTCLNDPPYVLSNENFDAETRSGNSLSAVEPVEVDYLHPGITQYNQDSLVISPISNNCFACSRGGFIYIFYVSDTGSYLINSYAVSIVGGANIVSNFIFSPDGRYIYASSNNNTLTIVNLQTTTPTVEAVVTGVTNYFVISVTPNGRWICTAGNGGVSIIDRNSNTVTNFNPNVIFSDVNVSPDSNFFYLLPTSTTTLYIFNNLTGTFQTISPTEPGVSFLAQPSRIGVDPTGSFIVYQARRVTNFSQSPGLVSFKRVGSTHSYNASLSMLFYMSSKLKPEFSTDNFGAGIATGQGGTAIFNVGIGGMSTVNIDSSFVTNSPRFLIQPGNYLLESGGGNVSTAYLKLLNISSVPAAFETIPIKNETNFTINNTVVSKDSKCFYAIGTDLLGSMKIRRWNIYPTKVNLNFSPKLVWTKSTTNASSHHFAINVENTAYFGNPLTYERIYAVSTDNVTPVPSQFGKGSYFDNEQKNIRLNYSPGPTGNYSSLTNQTGYSYVDWAWTNNNKLVSTTFYIGDNSTKLVPHTLGTTPKWVLIKEITAGTNWFQHIKGMLETHYFTFEQTYTSATTPLFIPSSWSPSFVCISSNNNVNQLDQQYIMIAFAEIDGLSKMGKYTPTNTSDKTWGTFVYTGFAPKFILIKRTNQSSAAYSWVAADTVQSVFNSFTTNIDKLVPGTNAAAANIGIDFFTNGFKIRSTSSVIGAGPDEYFYVAFAAAPFKYATISRPY